jgi:hypothetical protein
MLRVLLLFGKLPTKNLKQKKKKDDRQLAQTTDAVSKQQPVAAAEEAEQDAATPIKGQTEGIKAFR